MNYKVIDKETYYRKGVYRHFTEDCKCSTSMTARIDVTELVSCSKARGTKFYGHLEKSPKMSFGGALCAITPASCWRQSSLARCARGRFA